jgi:adenylate cyclase
MAATLQITPASAPSYEVTIGNTATIGRTSDNTVCFRGSPLVSRQHALIRCHDGFQFQLVDLGSRNGTHVNGERVVMPRNLEDGASIRVADNTIVFRRTGTDAASSNFEATIAGSAAAHANSVRWAALLVCDIRGFSAMAEHLAPPALAQTLGSWFREASALIHARGGIIDKFIGDAVLAYWAGIDTAGLDCEAASNCASELTHLASRHSWPNGEALRVGVALHAGAVNCGNVGVDAQRDATIIGDAVNTVFRLESVMKELNQRVLASSDFYAALRKAEGWTDLGDKQLKGKRQPIRIYGREK